MPDPFQTLGLEPRFTLDPAALEQRHRELSRALHPDRHASAPAAERRMVLGRAIEVNDAFRVLRDPLKRAEALLRQRGWAETETSGRVAPALLMEVMELREALQEAQARRDRPLLEDLGRQVEGRQAKILGALGEALDSNPGGPLEGPGALLAELRYLRRFLDEVEAILDELQEG